MNWLICRVWEWILVLQINRGRQLHIADNFQYTRLFLLLQPNIKEPHNQIGFWDSWADSQGSQCHPRKEADINGSPGTWDKLTNWQQLWLKLAILNRIRRQKLAKNGGSWNLNAMQKQTQQPLPTNQKEHFNKKLDKDWSGNMGGTEEAVPYLNQRLVVCPGPSADVIMFLKRLLFCTLDVYTGNLSKPAKPPVENDTSLLKTPWSSSVVNPQQGTPRDTGRLAIQLALEEQSNTADHLSFEFQPC